MERPALLILGGPTNGLDFDAQRELNGHLIDPRNRAATILIASQNRDEIKVLCDRVFVLADSRLSESPEDPDINAEDRAVRLGITS
jgi:ABC-2 type transport system ATP-binding protein